MAHSTCKKNKNIESVDLLDIDIPMFCVVLHNDDYTTFDFVIHILITIFHKSQQDAVRITACVHKKGQGIAGIYPLEIAEMKVKQVEEMANDAGFPLRVSIEEKS